MPSAEPRSDAGPKATEACNPTATAGKGLKFPGPAPGRATATHSDGLLQLANKAISVTWKLDKDRLSLYQIEDLAGGKTTKSVGELFRVRAAGVTGWINASELKVVGKPTVTDADVRCASRRLSERFSGRQLAAVLEGAGLRVHWRASLRDGANYVQQRVAVGPINAPLKIEELVLLDLAHASAGQVGIVEGSVVVADKLFFGYEHPMARNRAGLVYAKVGTWAPAQMSHPNRTFIEWDVTAALKGKGAYSALFDYTDGAHRLEIFRVELLENGVAKASDSHFGASGIVDVANAFELRLPTHDTKAKYMLKAEVRSDGGTDSHGRVEMANLEQGPRIHCSLEQETQLEVGGVLVGSSVIGVVPAGQLRRGFLHYLERERAHPYRTFLHYNSWYDIGYSSKYSEADALKVIETYGRELVKKRGVVLDSFLFDDGWDDPQTLWNFHSGFPSGFTPLKKAAAAYGAEPGIWLSPWGGYGVPKQQRLTHGKAQGYETDDKGFVLSGPKYYERYRSICLELVKKYGVNQFKFDGIGKSSGKFPGSEFDNDFAAAIQLISDLRQAKPDIYINLTTGTWPSPFWLLHADSIWRGGYDHAFLGVGTARQQWMTYRDAKTYQYIYQRGPLFPLSSLMVHGIIYANKARGLETHRGGDLRSEIRTAFGCGTQLQELYITPGLLTSVDWDDLAAAAKWARARAGILQDTHWVGGDPAAGQVYGWASWSDNNGVLVLRNPAATKGTISIDPKKVFELPLGAIGSYALTSPYADQRVKNVKLDAGAPYSFSLQPFEVLVFDAKGIADF
jgi:hypothetical protein